MTETIHNFYIFSKLFYSTCSIDSVIIPRILHPLQQQCLKFYLGDINIWVLDSMHAYVMQNICLGNIWNLMSGATRTQTAGSIL